MSLGLYREQPFDNNGKMLCIEPMCGKPIEHGQFFVEVQQYDQADANMKLAVHTSCFVKGFLGK